MFERLEILQIAYVLADKRRRFLDQAKGALLMGAAGEDVMLRGER